MMVKKCTDVRNESILLLSTPQRGEHWTVYKITLAH